MRELDVFDNIPAPLEPFEKKIDADNQRLLDEQLRERIENTRAKLTKKQLILIAIKIHVLRWLLNSAGYNRLVRRRDRLWLQYRKRLRLYIKNRDENLLLSVKKIAKQGQSVNHFLARLQRFAVMFDDLIAKLRAHEAVIAWEKHDTERHNALRREALNWAELLRAGFEQNAKIHHAYADKDGNWRIDTPKIMQIIVKPDRVYYEIKVSGQTVVERLFNRWHNALPYNVMISDLASRETLENLSTICNRDVTVERSQRGRNFFYVINRMDSPDGIPSRVLYQSLIDWYPVEDHAKTPWIAGVSQNRTVKFYDFESQPHILLAGSTQGGKSNHINQMIALMATMNTPAELQFILVDLKGGIEFTHWSGLKHQFRPMVKNADHVLEELKFLRSVMEKRLSSFEAVKAKNLMSYNAKVQNKIPRLILIIDEMATLIGLGELTNQIHTELRTLSSQGRAVGIHLVLCTQHTSVDVTPGWVKTNMSLRASAKMPSHNSSMVILDSISAALLPDVPGRFVFSIGRSEIIVQSPYISDNVIADVVKNSHSMDAPPYDIAPAPVEKFGRDDVIRIALDTMDGKLSASRIHDYIKNNNDICTLRTLRTLVDDIIDDALDGNLTHNNTRYTVVKNRKNYILKIIEQSNEQLSNESDVLPISSDDDTEEFTVYVLD